jgi:hypothetical protein
MKLLFIAGTDLSGSTVLDIALGSLPRVVGLGEVDNILDQKKRAFGETKVGDARELLCTCGEKGADCLVWGPVLSHIDDSPRSSYQENYDLLAKSVLRLYPRTEVIVDSSKQISALKKITSLTENQLTWLDEVLMVVLWRSPVSWLASDSRRAARRGRLRNRRIRARRLDKWGKRYNELLRFARESPFNSVLITLRAFQERPDSILSLIQPLADMTLPRGTTIDISKSSSHVLWGSHHRHDSAKSKKISKNQFPELRVLVTQLPIVVGSPAVYLAYRARFSFAANQIFRRLTHPRQARRAR